VVGGSPEETARYMQEEIERWRNVIKSANVKID
jgi:tripartite-type tricarboxylate transporter receptor subunit TctC